MAADPAFAATPARPTPTALTTATDSVNAPTTNIATLITGVAAGTKIVEIVCQGQYNVASVAGLVNFYIYDVGGTTYYMYDQIVIPAFTPTSTVPSWRSAKKYDNLILMGTNQSLRATLSTTQTSGSVKFHVEAATFT